MVELVAGMDTSGDPKSGNDKFLAIVIGTKESVLSIDKRLGSKKIHMSAINDKKTKNEIISRVSFDRENCIAFCIRIDRKIIITEITENKKILKKNISKRRIHHRYHNMLFHMLRENITTFLNKHGYTLDEVGFECDKDCRNLIRDLGLHHHDKGIPHMISDIVAWSNNKGLEPKGVISLDLRKEIRAKMINMFL